MHATACPKTKYYGLHACPQATYHSLSKDHIPWLVHRLPSMACPKTTYQQGLSKDHIPIGFVQRPHTNRACPKNAYHGLFKGYLLVIFHRSPSMGSPEAKYQGLSICYPQRLVNRPSTEASSPQTMYQSINKRLNRYKRKFYNFTPYNNLWSKKLVYWGLRMKKIHKETTMTILGEEKINNSWS